MAVNLSDCNLPEVSYSQEPEVQHSHLPQLAPGKEILATQHEQGPRPLPPLAKSKILGLERQTFLLVLVLVIVIIAAAIGGGVGGSLAVQNARSKASLSGQITTVVSVFPSSTQASASSANSQSISAASSAPPSSESLYIPRMPGSVNLVNSSCPTSGRITVNVMGKDATYSCREQIDFPGNDVTGFVAYTLEQCLESCSLTNFVQGRTVCVAVVHSPKLSQQYVNFKGNCFLKTATATEKTNSDWVGAILQE